MNAEFWAAIVGAVVGGIIASAIQLFSLREARKEREAVALERKRGLGYSLTVKMLRITSHLENLNRHVETDSKAAAHLQSQGLGFAVRQLANFPERIYFSPDEIGMLFGLNGHSLLNDLLLMDELHNATIDAFEKYSALRVALLEKMPPQVMHGDLGTAVLIEAQVQALKPHAYELNSLMASIKNSLGSDFEKASEVSNRLAKLLNEKIGLGVKLQLKQ